MVIMARFKTRSQTRLRKVTSSQGTRSPAFACRDNHHDPDAVDGGGAGDDDGDGDHLPRPVDEEAGGDEVEDAEESQHHHHCKGI